ncbi:MAG TPA: right-handed parallel beta-helix repeat-containing protein [Anaeromyxobacter sp.]|nr:right-handed parallel beta-helix repeat-containing protein [Anaeromyxobacter sp.]
MSRRRHALALLAALSAGWTCAVPPPPALESIAPPGAIAGAAADVAVRGSGFAPWVQANFAHPEASTVRGEFALALVRADLRIPLEQVAWVSERELSARVPPIATPGTYDLELVDPRGRAAVLPAAFAIDVAPGCGPDGTPCDDGNACTAGDACGAGECLPGPSVCGNTAPRACLEVTPAAAAPGEALSFDASCSTDDEDALPALQARFDFDGDGTWDTAFQPAAGVQQRAYASPGLWTAAVEVRDAGLLSDFASRYAVVTAPDDLVVVTTAADEADPGDTPEAPLGTGLSLREAIAYVNGLLAPRTILVGVAEPIVHDSPLPPLVTPSAAIVASPAVPLQFRDFAGGPLPCLALEAPAQLLLGATITGCTYASVALGNASDGARVAECTISGSPGAHGISGKASGTIGPRNTITGAGTAMKLVGSTYVVEENRIRENDDGIVAVAGIHLTVRRNRIVSNRHIGLQTTPSPTGSCTIVHNVFDANGDDAVNLQSFAGGVVARNNLFTRNGGYALRDGSPARTFDHNGFFENARGPIWSGTPGATDLLEDPVYGGDHRLAPGSPAVDRGLDTGLDVNGPGAGNWNGAAPDLGAWEAPYPAP